MTPQLALPRGLEVGDTASAPVTPGRTYRRRAVTVTGKVIRIGRSAVTLLTPQGYYTVVSANITRQVRP